MFLRPMYKMCGETSGQTGFCEILLGFCTHRSVKQRLRVDSRAYRSVTRFLFSSAPNPENVYRSEAPERCWTGESLLFRLWAVFTNAT